MRRSRVFVAVAAVGAVVLVVLGGLLITGSLSGSGTAPVQGEPAEAGHALDERDTEITEDGDVGRLRTSAPVPEDAVAIPPAPVTGAPDVYAAWVARVLFARDTRFYDRDDCRAVLLDEFDPAARADPRLGEDMFVVFAESVDRRIPAAWLWARMADAGEYSTWQTTRVTTPDSFTELAASGEGLQPGWAVRNVTGVETKHSRAPETDELVVYELAHTVSVAMSCGPVHQRCHLLLIGDQVAQ